MTDQTETMERIARERFGFDALHPAQREAIGALVNGRDTLAVLPTGGGKSAIYQIAGLLLPGPTVVVSPLLALQRDQMEALQEFGVEEVAAMNSAVSRTERREAMADLDEGDLEFLFTAPEQFHREETLDQLRAARPSLFVVDEAHCISEWGPDFRPDYLRLGAVIEELGHPPVLALTATASGRVREEITARLGLRDPLTIVESFDRPNIALNVERFEEEGRKRDALLAAVEGAEKPGIVYAATRRHVEELAGALRERGINALAYHAGLKSAEREHIEEAFMHDEADVMVATNAFGMGIDKPNIRFVFHYDIPDSLDAYYQEIGRAGRDGEPARALLFYRPADLGLHRFFAGTGKVDEEQIEEVVEAIADHDGHIEEDELREETELSTAKLNTALARLEETGAVDIRPDGEVLEAASAADDPAEAAAEAEEHRRAVEESRREMMRGYAETHACRRAYLLNYFGQDYAGPCGSCDQCAAGAAAPSHEGPFPLHSRVRHQTLGEGEVARYEDDKMVVLFDDVGYKTLLTAFVAETGALEAAGL